MAAAPFASVGQSADHRSSVLASHRGVDRSHHLAHRFTRFPMVVPELSVEYSCQFREIKQRGRIFEWRRLFGELVMSISKEDHERIATAIHSAEARTSGEIVCVLAQTSSHATALPVLIAAVVSLTMPWLLMTFTAMTFYRILSLQILAFLAALIPLCLPRVRVALMPRKARRAIAHRVAMEQFTSRGIGQRKNGAGVLIFVSLAERYARIITDDEIAARV